MQPAMKEFEVKITRQQSEVEEAQRLRFEVFNLEMKKGLESSYRAGLDMDEFDQYCDHLIVRDLRTRRIVGTYRLLLGSEVRGRCGFYAEEEFDLENVKKLGGELLELGRSCAHKDYRDKALVNFMWQAIADYVRAHQVRYLFGCASLYTVEPRAVSEYYSFLKSRYYAPVEFRVQPKPRHAFSELAEEARTRNDQTLFLRLPSLIKGYLRIGALLCGPPALDPEFGTTDLFLILDITKMDSEYLQRFGFSDSQDHRAAH